MLEMRKSNSYGENRFTPTNTSTLKANSQGNGFLLLNPFTVHCQGNVLQKKIKDMHRPFGVSLDYKILDNTTVYASSPMF